jgi:hypothetical protein
MTVDQKRSIGVGAAGLLVITGAFLQWFSKEGESISGVEFGAMLIVVPAGMVVVGAVVAFVYKKRLPLLARIVFVSLYLIMGLIVYVLPLALMDTRYAFSGPGVPLTVLAVLVGGACSVAWLLQRPQDPLPHPTAEVE